MTDARYPSDWVTKYPRFRDLSMLERGVLITLLAWSAGAETDGVIPAKELKQLEYVEGDEFHTGFELLCRRDWLIEPVGDSGAWKLKNWGVPHWQEGLGQTTRAEHEARRAKDAKRKRRRRAEDKAAREAMNQRTDQPAASAPVIEPAQSGTGYVDSTPASTPVTTEMLENDDLPPADINGTVLKDRREFIDAYLRRPQHHTSEPVIASTGIPNAEQQRLAFAKEMVAGGVNV